MQDMNMAEEFLELKDACSCIDRRPLPHTKPGAKPAAEQFEEGKEHIVVPHFEVTSCDSQDQTIRIPPQ